MALMATALTRRLMSIRGVITDPVTALVTAFYRAPRRRTTGHAPMPARCARGIPDVARMTVTATGCPTGMTVGPMTRAAVSLVSFTKA